MKITIPLTLDHAARFLGIATVLGLASCQGFEPEYRDPEQGSRPVRVRFEGVENYDPLLLARAIDAQVLEMSRTGSDAPVPEAKKRLVAAYQLQGFADVEVDVELVRANPESSADFDVLHVRVTEGRRFVVTSIQIVGNHSIASPDLLANWRRRPSGALGLGDPIFVRAEIERFARDVQSIYMKTGYLESRVERPEIAKNEDGNVDVTLRLREGPLYSVLRLRVDKALAEPLRALPPTLEGKPFSAREVEGFRREIVRQLRELGYADPDAEVVIGAVAAKNGVDLLVRGSPGEKRKIGEVVIAGNQRTRAKDIREALEFEIGDDFVGSVEDQSVRRLLAGGEYRKVEVKHETRDDGTLRIILEVDEIERPPVDIEVGYGSYVGPRGAARFHALDVLETGLDLRIQGEVHRRGHVVGAAILAPDLVEDTTLSLGAAHSRYRHPSYSDREWQAEAAIRYRIRGPLSARLGYRFEDHHGSWSDTAVPRLDQASYDRSVAFGELRSTDRDAPIRTRDGHDMSLGAEWSDESLGGDIDLFRFDVDARYWLPLTHRLHVFLRARSGAVWPSSSRAGIPIQERYFNGGEDTVRSFREAQLGPEDSHGEALGGHFRNIFNVEARLALQDPVDLILFADAGNIGRRVHSYGLSDLRYALGAGLRYALPTGIPLRLDAAWNPDRRSGEEEWVLHFRMGLLD